MSADADFTMTAPALIKAAEHYLACDTFHIEEGGSRHRCTTCGLSDMAHIIVALRTELQTLKEWISEINPESPLPGEGENDYDEEHRRRFRMTSAERQQGLVDEGHEDWLADELEGR